VENGYIKMGKKRKVENGYMKMDKKGKWKMAI